MGAATSRSDVFFSLQATSALHASLRDGIPDILWIPRDGRNPSSDREGPVALWGKPLNASQSAAVPLASLDDEGDLRLHFDIGRVIEGILLESYHDGLQPTVEMRLPFNYSRVPTWMKKIARGLRSGSFHAAPAIRFPPGEPSFVVDWLRMLTRAAGCTEDILSLAGPWPENRQAAVTITHDVDTDWVLRHTDWMDRICDVEEGQGFFGAWYCVPSYSRKAASQRGIERLLARGCEVGCHGYNHDAKWPLLEGASFEARLNAARRFRHRWGARGFRSEWIWRTPQFLQAIAEVFDYDSSVPNVLLRFTDPTGNGCGTCFPYQTFGGLVEIPLTLAMDEWHHFTGADPATHWKHLVAGARQIIHRGGLVVFSIHPQSHQAANEETLAIVELALHEVAAIPNLWVARPDQIVDWVTQSCAGHFALAKGESVFEESYSASVHAVAVNASSRDLAFDGFLRGPRMPRLHDERGGR